MVPHPRSGVPPRPPQDGRLRPDPALRRAPKVLGPSVRPQGPQQARPPQPLLKDPYRLALMMFLVQTVSRVASSLGPIGEMRPALLLFVFCVLFALMNPAKAFDRDLFRRLIPQLTLGQAFIACCSAVFGISLGHAANFILNEYWKTLAYCWLLMSSMRDTIHVRWTVWAVTFAGFVLAFLSLYVVGISKTQGTGSYDANDIGLIMVTTIPLAILCLQTSGRWGKIVAVIGLALTVMTVVKSASRGAFLGAAAVGLVMLVFLPGISVFKRIAIVVAMVATMTMVAPVGYWDTMKATVTNPQSDYNWDAYTGRRNIAKRGIGYMMQYPVFGVGIGNFGFAEGQLSARAKAGETIIRWAAPHNSLVQAGAETGMTGLGVWMFLLLVSAGGVWRLRRRMPSWGVGAPDQRFLFLATLYVPIAFVGFAITATFVSFAWSDQYYILPAIVVGVYKAFEGISASRSGGAPVVPRGRA